MTTIALPPCPSCKQSMTGVYVKKHGCGRCGLLVATAASLLAVKAATQ